MTLTAHHEVVLPHRPEQVWEKLFDPEAAKGWLGVAGYVMPERAGAAFCWFYDPGSRMPTAYVGRVLAADRPHRLVLLLELFASGAESVVTIELTEAVEHATWSTVLSLRHEGFPENGMGPFEHDGWTHSWEHHLDLLADHLGGTSSNYQLGHDAELGVIPVGVVRGRGVLVHRVSTASPAEAAGVQAGDVIRSADQHLFDSMEDFDQWIDTRVPGEEVHLRIGDRVVSIVLRAKELPEYLLQRG
ncbi:MAG: SRPBCC domain-containing protein [Pseudonocardiaceae bacterium]